MDEEKVGVENRDQEVLDLGVGLCESLGNILEDIKERTEEKTVTFSKFDDVYHMGIEFHRIVSVLCSAAFKAEDHGDTMSILDAMEQVCEGFERDLKAEWPIQESASQEGGA